MFKMCSEILVLKNMIFVWKIWILDGKIQFGFSKLAGLYVEALPGHQLQMPCTYRLDHMKYTF